MAAVFPLSAPPAAYQLALRMPGSSPVNASWRKQIRQIPK